MKKIFVFLCFFSGVSSPSWSCSVAVPKFGYQIHDNVVVYQDGRRGSISNVEGADVATFSTDEDKFYSKFYAVDAKHVYYKGTILKGANPSHTKFLGGGYDRDNYQNDGYLKDDHTVYFFGQLIEGADAPSFESMPAYEDIKSPTERVGYFRDKHHIYLNGKVLAGDAATVRSLPYQYYVDAQHIYAQGTVLEGALPNAFKMKSAYLLSNGRVFLNDTRLPLEAQSFEEVNKVYGSIYTSCEAPPYWGSVLKDRNGIYVYQPSGEINILKDVDAASFRIVSDGLAVDKNQIYLYSTSSDHLQFIPLQLSPQKAYREHIKTANESSVFYKDDHRIYVMDDTAPKNLEETMKVDASTFGVFTKLDKMLIFNDKNNLYRYYRGELLPLGDLSAKAELVCLGTRVACFLEGDTLYYLFDDSSMQTIKVNASELRCFADNIPLPSLMAYKIHPMQCFNRTRIYDFNDGYALSQGDYEKLLPYAVAQNDVQELRKKSLESVVITREPLIKPL